LSTELPNSTKNGGRALGWVTQPGPITVMAGLDPAIHVLDATAASRTVARMRGGWVYIMTNHPDGTLYNSVTADIARRAFEHREGLCEGFTKRYALTRLVWYESHTDIRAAIQPERNMKHWPGAWKVRLILAMNPEWRDLYFDPNE
jgi:putative endonuclease